ncbi:MAG TPA: nucleoside monophosphate kinase [Candidatus Dormibacteraeota bacterium]|nr:nucleoside monophosphate kinase [Candidatus Dormibacteraeota bacterium]
MILLMGIAGSGKGTQGKMLADKYGLHLISMGDVLRMYVTGKQRERMLAGGLLDDAEIIAIIDKVLSSIPDKQEVLIDGFPRTIPQAQWLLDQVENGRFQLDVALHLKASQDAVKQRLLSRARIDDTEEAIEARFSEYDRSTKPLLAWLSDHNIEVINIDAEHSEEEVNNDLAQHLQNLHKS